MQPHGGVECVLVSVEGVAVIGVQDPPLLQVRHGAFDRGANRTDPRVVLALWSVSCPPTCLRRGVKYPLPRCPRSANT